MREVSELAHVHRSTFYRYFASVPDAFDAFEEQLIDEIVERASNVVVSSGGGWDSRPCRSRSSTP